jgi:hypothetical protein
MPYTEDARMRSWSKGSTNALVRHIGKVRALTPEDRGRLLEAVAAVPVLPPKGRTPDPASGVEGAVSLPRTTAKATR